MIIWQRAALSSSYVYIIVVYHRCGRGALRCFDDVLLPLMLLLPAAGVAHSYETAQSAHYTILSARSINVTAIPIQFERSAAELNFFSCSNVHAETENAIAILHGWRVVRTIFRMENCQSPPDFMPLRRNSFACLGKSFDAGQPSGISARTRQRHTQIAHQQSGTKYTHMNVVLVLELRSSLPITVTQEIFYKLTMQSEYSI